MRPLPEAIPRLSGLDWDALEAEILRRARAYDVDTAPEAIVERALAYPFAPPGESYFLDGREPRPVRAEDLRGERHALLAYGSNSSTRALLRKFPGGVRMPVLRGALDGFDVVYSSHLSAYGSVPVTVHPIAGARIDTFVLLVSDEQFVRLAETEFNYAIRRLDGVRFTGPEVEIDAPLAFVSRHGALGLDGDPVRLVDRTQRESLERVRSHLAPDESLEEFVVANVRDPGRSVAFTARLRERGVPFEASGTTILDV